MSSILQVNDNIILKYGGIIDKNNSLGEKDQLLASDGAKCFWNNLPGRTIIEYKGGQNYSAEGGPNFTTDITAAANTPKLLAKITAPHSGQWLVVSTVAFTPTSSGTHWSCVGWSTSNEVKQINSDSRSNSTTYQNRHTMYTVFQTDDLYLMGNADVAGTWNRSSSTSWNIRLIQLA